MPRPRWPAPRGATSSLALTRGSDSANRVRRRFVGDHFGVRRPRGPPPPRDVTPPRREPLLVLSARALDEHPLDEALLGIGREQRATRRIELFARDHVRDV